ncbi:MAG TPA: FliA/WhiG family RNA polymerase sigma factor [Acidobacteriaceae bacterium]|nr:FliA/WhiG family RNA polymerase sigma factor [Acidobacteriaceae bacterium]
MSTPSTPSTPHEELLPAQPILDSRDLTAARPLTSEERERLLLEHLVSVRFIARKLHQTLPRHVELDDLISAGMVGLMEACNRFDTRRHVQFKSYAQFRIRGAILDWLRTLDWGPRELRRKARAIAETTRVLAQRLGRAPAEHEIAGAMEIELEELQQLMGELRSLELGSLNAEHSKDEEDEELEYVPASAEEDPLFLCLAAESRQRLIDAIEELPEKERLVLTLYYYEELTMREIGLTLGVVESRVSQIHSGAVRRLRAVMGQTTRRADVQPRRSAQRSSTRPSRRTAA